MYQSVLVLAICRFEDGVVITDLWPQLAYVLTILVWDNECSTVTTIITTSEPALDVAARTEADILDLLCYTTSALDFFSQQFPLRHSGDSAVVFCIHTFCTSHSGSLPTVPRLQDGTGQGDHVSCIPERGIRLSARGRQRGVLLCGARWHFHYYGASKATVPSVRSQALQQSSEILILNRHPQLTRPCGGWSQRSDEEGQEPKQVGSLSRGHGFGER
eukprot:220526-Prorocentrum_minimum.AAC.2